ncbi:hypothetical protein DFJ73DRAFT_354903 [Zopfochytrium polystomum]|nr:hypothetical protein DFJ73DRAFT_354903 [Zopfochytrium polystomum]
MEQRLQFLLVMSSLSRRLVALIAAGIALLALSSPAAALHEDQAGQFDWYKQQVGVPKFASFQRHGTKAGLFVGTKKNVIASLNPKNGGIVWRQILAQNDELLHLSSDDQAVLTVSGNHDRHVRLWDASSGLILWEFGFESATTEGGTDI